MYITSFTGDNFDYKKHGYSGRYIKQVIIDIREKKKKRPYSNLILREAEVKHGLNYKTAKGVLDKMVLDNKIIVNTENSHFINTKSHSTSESEVKALVKRSNISPNISPNIFLFMLEFDPTMVAKRSNISPSISPKIFTRGSKKDWVEFRAEGCTVSRHLDTKKRKAIAAFFFYFLFRYFHCHRGLSGRASYPLSRPWAKFVPLHFLVAPLCYSFLIDA